jgi:hypothetical protein
MVGRRGTAGVLAAVALVLAACARPAPPPAQVALRTPDAATTVLDGTDPARLAVATSAALFARSPAAVLAPAADAAAQAEAAGAAAAAGVPLLLLTPAGADPAGVAGELDRLGAATVLAVGDDAEAWAERSGRAVVTDPAELPEAATPPAPPVLVLVTGPEPAAAATARAAGVAVETVPDADPRADPDLLGRPRPEHVLALGAAFGPADRLDARLAAAATGTELPGGGQLLFPARRMVALYGHPGAPALGVLGEQPVDAAVRRAQTLAAEYDAVSAEPVVPAFEVIATVADSGPGPDGDYSAEASVEFLRPWVDAAGAAGVYVVLDLQPGRTDFLTQARRYAELLAQPHVGLALDPEWRLDPDQQHLRQIGSVGIDEVNAVVTWLADLTRERALPQKLLLLHQFRTGMTSGRERLDTSRDELAVMIHADGFGPPGEKLETWNALREGAPPGVWWGWKNFYDEDSPTFTPRQTMEIAPEPPVFVSYQ